MEARLAQVEADVATIKATMATKSDIAELRADMHEMNAGISRWMLGTVLTVIGTVVLGFIGLTVTMVNANKPAAPAAQPTVIVVPGPASPAPSTPR